MIAGKLAITAAAAGLALGSLGAPSALSADEHMQEAEHCVSLTRIRSSDVIDDKRILFEMLGGDYYLNELPHKCPGLDFEDAFMYRTSIGQLCDMDIVTVLTNAGFGLQPGASCGLGMFRPISEQEAKMLMEQSDE